MHNAFCVQYSWENMDCQVHWGEALESYRYVVDSNELLATVTSFMFFKFNIRQSKWINTIATSTFGVLLIHAHAHTIRKWL